jgi:SAM-dependent methyltransferase
MINKFEIYIRKIIWYFHELGILPVFLFPQKFKRKLKAREIFFNQNIKYNKNGYYYLYPGLNQDNLNKYYKLFYWNNRGKTEGVNSRDINHFQIISSYINLLQYKNFNFVNFGAGHGGISHLIHAAGNNVINVEPSDLMLKYNTRYKKIDNFSQLVEKIDFFYSSHSLEHVSNIDDFLSNLISKLNHNSFIFIEVPNSEFPSNGGINGKMVLPHTYYFTEKFFKKLPFKQIHLEFKGDVIIYFGTYTNV